MLDLLRRAGFGPAEATRVVQQLGVLLNVGVGVAPAPGAREGGDAQKWAALARYPRMREAAQHLGSWRKVEDIGIEILVRGVEGVLGKPKRESSKKR
jgi:hypothetical protein